MLSIKISVSRMSSLVLGLFVIFVSLTSHSGNWNMQWKDQDVSLTLGRQSYHIRISPQAKRVVAFGDRLYILSREDKLSIFQLGSLQTTEKKTNFVPQAIINLKGKFSGEITDMALSFSPWRQGVQKTSILFSLKEKDAYRAEIIVFNQVKGNAKFSTANATEDSIIFALKNVKKIPLLGNGRLVAIQEGTTKMFKLLTLDVQGQVLIEYDWLGPMDIQLAGTYPLPKKYTFDNLGVPFSDGDYINLYAVNKKYLRISMLELRARQQMLRTQFILAWKNQVKGNTWTEQLLGFGALASVIRSIDEYLGDPNFDPKLLKADPEFQAIMQDFDANKAYGWAKSSGFFSEDALKKMQVEHAKLSGSGKSWAVTVGLMAAFLVSTKLHGSNAAAFLSSVTNRINHRLLGTKMGKKVVDVQRRIRGRMIRNHLENQHSARVIIQSEKQLLKLAKLESEAFATEVKKLEELKNTSGTLKVRAQRVLDLWEATSTKLTSKNNNLNMDFLKVTTDKMEKIQSKLKPLLARERILTERISALKTKSEVAQGFRGLKVLETKLTQLERKIKPLEKKYFQLKKFGSLKVKLTPIFDFFWKTSHGKARSFNKLYEKLLTQVDEIKYLEQAVEHEKAMRSAKAKIVVIEHKVNEGFAKQSVGPGRKADLGDNLPFFEDLEASGEPLKRLLAKKEEILSNMDAQGVRSQWEGVLNSSVEYYTKHFNSWLKAKSSLSSLPKKWEKMNLKQLIFTKSEKGRRVHPVFDNIAALSAAYTRMFIPEKWYAKTGASDEFMGQWVRKDQVVQTLSNGEKKVKTIEVTGDHAKLAMEYAAGDISVDMLIQIWSRQWLDDPNERVLAWGVDVDPSSRVNGNNYVGPSFNGKEYGVHSDFIGQVLDQIWGWTLGMPAGYARMFTNSGSGAHIGLMHRFLDKEKKAWLPHLYLFGMAESYIQWGIAKEMILLDFWMDNSDKDSSFSNYLAGQDKGNNPKEFDELRAKFAGRNTSFRSLAERFAMARIVSGGYIYPPYIVKSEADQAVAMLTRRTGIYRVVVGGLVMPFMTGYMSHKWFGEYFGFSNPQMIRVLKALKAEGVLQKIDSEGMTDLNEWTHSELTAITYLIFNMEMAKFHKEEPMPVKEGPAAMALWSAKFQQRLFPDKLFAKLKKEDKLPTRIKVANFGKNVKYRYQSEIKPMKRLVEGLNKGITPISIQTSNIKPVAIISKALPEDASQNELQTKLLEIQDIHSRVLDVLRVLKENTDTKDNIHAKKAMLIITDGIILSDAFLFNTYLSSNLAKLAAGWSGRAKNILQQVGTTVLVTSVPAYFVLDGQAEAHVESQKYIRTLLLELSRMLFVATDEVVSGMVNKDVNRVVAKGDIEALRSHQVKISALSSQMREALSHVTAQGQNLLSDRVYRIAGVADDMGSYGVGFMLSWMLGRHIFFRASSGMLVRMTDKYAFTMLKFYGIEWLTASSFVNQHEQDIQVNLRDFLTLYQVYQMIKKENRSLCVGLAKLAEPGSDNTACLKVINNKAVDQDIEKFREDILKLVIEDKKDEKNAS